MTNSDTLGILSVAEVAEELGRPVRTIHRWIAAGQIAAVKLGDGQTSAYIVTREELDRFKAEQASA